MSEQQVVKNPFEVLKGLNVPDGLLAIGEYRGYEERDSKGTMYYKVKLLIGDNVKKFDIKPDQLLNLQGLNLKNGSKMLVSYYEFNGRFGTNSVLVSYVAL